MTAKLLLEKFEFEKVGTCELQGCLLRKMYHS